MKRLLLITILFLTGSVFSADFTKAAKDIEAELKQVNAKLDGARNRIFKEREELSGEISKAKSELENNKNRAK